MRATRTIHAVAAAVVIALTTTSAIAQENQQAQPQALTDVYACAATTDNTARLACYDAAVGRLRSAEQEGRVVAVDREQVANLERDAFGFSLPSISGLLRGERNTEAVANIDMQVERIARLGDGRSRFIMTNGQTWAQIEPQSTSNVRPGDTITIRRAALGSFVLSPVRGALHRVRRVN